MCLQCLRFCTVSVRVGGSFFTVLATHFLLIHVKYVYVSFSLKSASEQMGGPGGGAVEGLVTVGSLAGMVELGGHRKQ